MKTYNITVTVPAAQADKALRIIRAMNLTAINRNGIITVHNFGSVATVRNLLTSNQITIISNPALL